MPFSDSAAVHVAGFKKRKVRSLALNNGNVYFYWRLHQKMQQRFACLHHLSSKTPIWPPDVFGRTSWFEWERLGLWVLWRRLVWTCLWTVCLLRRCVALRSGIAWRHCLRVDGITRWTVWKSAITDTHIPLIQSGQSKGSALGSNYRNIRYARTWPNMEIYSVSHKLIIFCVLLHCTTFIH